jgi:uncharacterized protein YyaL (SSP411 family)
MSHNRLSEETSPYLLQHKDNPVHWWAWGPEALAEAKATGKPILLSVGYAACHWCHVMAHESFEDDATAGVMNELFVNIKVDREERPDIDAIYMSALHKLGQQGGWPLTMFLDTDARPFWGGTYFPKDRGFGRPAFTDVLARVAGIHRDQHDDVLHNATILTEALARHEHTGKAIVLDDRLLDDLTVRMVRAVDMTHGGLNGAPKFPQWSFFWLLWRGAMRYGHDSARTAVVTTLRNICQGGIYDHIGGGFARYAVDERWLVPHFEKMLYDNALLVDLLTEVWRDTQDPLFAQRIAETVTWLLREMVTEEGGFASSLDADSEGEEGKFYVWSLGEVHKILGDDDARIFAQAYDITEAGNFEGHNIANRLDIQALGSADAEAHLRTLRDKLLAARAQRIRPGFDDKVLADWNGLMIAALSRAAVVFDRPDWQEAAKRAFLCVEDRMSRDGRLLHSYRAGQAKAPATASDYANMIWAAIRLYEATGDQYYLTAIERWLEILDKHYWLTDRGGYAMAADDTADVIVRLAPASDDATPNANAVMLSNLAALGFLTGETGHAKRAIQLIDAYASAIAQNPIGHAGLLAGAMDHIAPALVLVYAQPATAGADSAGMVAALHRRSLPGATEIVVRDPKAWAAPAAVTDGKPAQDTPTAYLCAGTTCSLPLTDSELFAGELSLLGRVRTHDA